MASEEPLAGVSTAAVQGLCRQDVRSSFRRLSPTDYPEVSLYSWDEIYGHGDNMAPGGLYLAARMTRELRLRKGDVVLDVGCGRGDSSLFLSQHFGVTVVCFDLWIPSTYLGRKFAEKGCRHSVFPLDLDATDDLPFPDDYFDALFCIQALHSFGGEAGVLRRLLRHLKLGGRFAVGGSCFNQEPANGHLPQIYSRTDDWDAEYQKYHSPSWWKELFESTRLVDVVECEELPEGLVMWEDKVLWHGDRAGWSQEWFTKSRWLLEHLFYSRKHRPSLTHYVATVQKKRGTAQP